jgi:hypothetical protein
MRPNHAVKTGAHRRRFAPWWSLLPGTLARNECSFAPVIFAILACSVSADGDLIVASRFRRTSVSQNRYRVVPKALQDQSGRLREGQARGFPRPRPHATHVSPLLLRRPSSRQ